MSEPSIAAVTSSETGLQVTARRPRRTWDLVLTIVLLLIAIGVALLASVFGVFLLAFGSDSCGARACNYDVMTTGMLVAMIGPWVPAVLALIASIVLLALRRLAFWVPLVSGALSIAALVLGFVAGSGVGPA